MTQIGEITADHDPELTRSAAAASTEAPARGRARHQLARAPARVGRYVIVELHGEGGMGQVYAAYDPALDRKIALKLLRADRTGDEQRARLLHEAKAMARLSHPNVVTVHDVGMYRDDVYIAMEFVTGCTLDAWIQAAPRSRTDIVARFVDAGRGLQAAHAAGLVHRDFKPKNVLVGEDGRVKVTDFGVARLLSPLPRARGSRERELGQPDTPVHVTRTGVLLGTPAYMAPEQFAARELDARCDVFAFCVALYESLLGRRPFTGSNFHALASNVLAGRRVDNPRERELPRWLFTAIVRGLAPDPDARWPSMRALLEVLDNDPARRRRRLLAPAVIGLAFASAGAGLWMYVEHRRALCAGADQKIAEFWSDARKQQVGAAFAASELPYAPATFERVSTLLDAHASRWIAASEDACEATRIRGEQSESMLDARARCLERRRRELAEFVDVLEVARPAAIEHAVYSAGELARPERCSDPDYVLAILPPPNDPALAERVNAQRAQLAGVRSSRQAGAYDDALERATVLDETAKTLAYGPLVAEARLELGRARERTGAYTGAAESLQESLLEAEAVGHAEVAREAATALCKTVGQLLARRDEGLRWCALARAKARADGDPLARASSLHAFGGVLLKHGRYDDALAQYRRALELRASAGRADGLASASVLHQIGAVHVGRSEYDEALTVHRRALAIIDREVGPEHPMRAVGHVQLGTVAFARRQLDEALREYERALAIQELALGPEHPATALTRIKIGNIEVVKGLHARARENFERAAAVSEASLGPEHPALADALMSLGNTYLRERRFDEALLAYKRCHGIYERMFGRAHTATAASLGSLGNTYRQLNQSDLARAHLEAALAAFASTVGEGHPDHATTLSNLGDLFHVIGDHARALEYYRRSAAGYEAALGPEHPQLYFSVSGVARALLALERFDDAKPEAERALTLLEAHPGDPGHLADARYLLARSLWGRDTDRARARELAELALVGFREIGFREAIDEVDTWLQEHPASRSGRR